MPMLATVEEFEEYLENHNCPYCYAEDIVEDGRTVEGDVTRVVKYCSKCELRWTEIWQGGKMTGLWLDDAE